MTDSTIIHTDTGRRRDRDYLGDGVTATHDDIQIWLSTPRNGDEIHEIALDRATFDSLLRYARTLGWIP